jgi:hypothetical protein
MDTTDPQMPREATPANPTEQVSGESGVIEAIEASEYERAHPMPFRTDGPRHFIPGAINDQLVVAQGSATGSARLSSEHMAGLLYNAGTIGHHLAPYDARYASNYGEATREPEQVEKR